MDGASHCCENTKAAQLAMPILHKNCLPLLLGLFLICISLTFRDPGPRSEPPVKPYRTLNLYFAAHNDILIPALIPYCLLATLRLIAAGHKSLYKFTTRDLFWVGSPQHGAGVGHDSVLTLR